MLWAPSFEGAPPPILPVYTEDGKQVFCHGKATAEGRTYEIADVPQNRAMVSVLTQFSVVDAVEDPREAVIARLRELGIPHKKNEKLETLQRKLDA